MMLITNIFVVAGVMICMIPYFSCLVIGRTILGITTGFFSLLVPLSIGESIPREISGTLGSLHQLLVPQFSIYNLIFRLPLQCFLCSALDFLFPKTLVLKMNQILHPLKSGV
jgi:hypothetical protein